jgi:peptidoglycan/xylan/chitin deacetylase (PgdA/CDA1 family)
MRYALVLACIGFAGVASAAECGPDKLGTSRVLEVGTEGGLQIGLKTYPQTLPLKDHEVILTFDDGPDPDDTPPILAALAEQCVRATFFVIGAKVDAHPDLARRELAEGHTIAHHTYTHPQPTVNMMKPAEARTDILRGMITIERVLYGADFPNGEPKDLSGLKLHTPFFRFPGFADTRDLEQWFADNNVATLSTDLWASDWLKMTPEAEMKLIFDRLEKPKRGMLLLHDRVAWTAQMLPRFLVELKKRGYHIVHIVAGPGRAETVPAPAGWVSETGRTIGAIKPRMDGPPTPRPPGPIPVKPAPTE